MENELKQFQAVIELFRKLSVGTVDDAPPTFMEICKHPYSRFEEICSRILQFFFNPNADHHMGDLWLSALFSVLKHDYTPLNNEEVTVATEEYADGKRIDLTICASSYVIGIENKITADVYNPLHIYRKHLEKSYPTKERIMLVLSLKTIIDKSELDKNRFASVTYRELFDAVRQRMGHYITPCNTAYLPYMLDFMKTLDNMDNNHSKAEHDFFYDHQEVIDKLIERFNNFKNNRLTCQKEQIARIKQRICDATGADWWIYQGWDLGISFNDKLNRIGIESYFEETKENPCAAFRICITTWTMKDWVPYKEEVLAAFPNHAELQENKDNRADLLLPTLSGDNQDGIIEALKDAYHKMVAITSQEKYQKKVVE